MKKFFKYIENLWLGADGKISLRAVLAIAFSIDFINNLSFAVRKWAQERSLEGLSMTLGIEAGLIVALLGITAWSNVNVTKIQAENSPTPHPSIKAENIEQVIVPVVATQESPKPLID